MIDNLRWKTTFDEIQLLMDEDLGWMQTFNLRTTFDGTLPLLEHNL